MARKLALAGWRWLHGGQVKIGKRNSVAWKNLSPPVNNL
jgi:hypothetical protein